MPANSRWDLIRRLRVNNHGHVIQIPHMYIFKLQKKGEEWPKAVAEARMWLSLNISQQLY